MISALAGVFSGYLANLIIIGFYFIEACIVTIAYNAIIPKYANEFNFELPFGKVSVWFVWGSIILLHFVAKYIKMIVPALVKIDNSTSNEDNSKLNS